MVAEPERLKRRPHAGIFPIPFVTQVFSGKPDFRVHNDDRREMVGKRKLCQLCGDRLGDDIVFAGSRASLNRRRFGEPPMHLECAEWAIEVCPFLAGRGWRYEADYPGGVELLQNPRRNYRIYFIKAEGFRMVKDRERGRGVVYELTGDTYWPWRSVDT